MKGDFFPHVMVETYRDSKKPHPRVRVCPGQGLRTDLNIRFPRELRKQFDIGQKFHCDLAEGNNQYMLKGDIQLIQTTTFSHSGKKTKEDFTPAQATGKPKKVKKVKGKGDIGPKMGQRKLKF